MAWELVESVNGTIEHKDLIEVYRLLSESTNGYHQRLAAKLQDLAKLAKYEKVETISRWEDEGGAIPHTNGNPLDK
jgi:hypothetical protein